MMMDKDKQEGTVLPKAMHASPCLAGKELIGVELPMEKVRFPKLLSIKRNGIRALAINGEWKSRAMKDVHMHPEIRAQFQALLDFSKKNQMVLDGEFNSPSCNTVGETISALAGTIETPSDFVYSCFYSLSRREWNLGTGDMGTYSARAAHLPQLCRGLDRVSQSLVPSRAVLEDWIKSWENRNVEGFILIDPAASYKHGKSTAVEQISCKYKYYADPDDGKIIGMTRRRQRKEGVEGGTRPDGYAQAVHTQDSFEETSVGGCLEVLFEGEVIHCPFPLNYSMFDREAAFLNFGTGGEDDLKGKWITFQRLACETRGKPMCIKNVEIRDDKD